MDDTAHAAALGPFAHLPAYEFDFDYRGESVGGSGAWSDYDEGAYGALDDFDSYMFAGDDDSESGPAAPVPGAPRPGGAGGVSWADVAAAPVFSPDGIRIDVSKLYTGCAKQTVLIFVPRSAVELAGLVYGKVAHLLQQAGARLIFVSAWSPEQALTFLSRFERVSPFPGLLICDPEVALFAAFGFVRSALRALVSVGKVSAPMRQGMRNAFSTVSYRAQNRDIASTAVPSKRLKCGAVVLPTVKGGTKTPAVSYIAEEAASTGTGCYLDVLAVCGVNDAFVPDVDVSQVYSRFNSMRATSIKARSADEKEATRSKRRSGRRNPLSGS